MRLILLIAVIALLADAYFYSGAYTKSAYQQVSIAAQHLVDLVGEAVQIGPDRESSTGSTRL